MKSRRYVLAVSTIALATLAFFQNCNNSMSPAKSDMSSGAGLSPNPSPSPGPSNPAPMPAPMPAAGPKDLSLATWSPISTVNAPTDNLCPSAVWTGTRMLLVGGTNQDAAIQGSGTFVDSYDPATDTWTRLNTTNNPPGRISATAVWTGDRLIHFGGRKFSPNCIAQGCWYYETYSLDLNTLAWTKVANAPILEGLYVARFGHASVWTGNRMLTYSGASPYQLFNIAANYDPVANVWAQSPSGPEGRSHLSGAMVGTKAYFWGGANEIDFHSATATGFNYGLVFDVIAQTWTQVMQNAPLMPRAAAAMAANQTHIAVWGGHLAGANFGDGAVYDVAANTWKSLPTAGAPSPRECAASVWTGNAFIVWGGVNGGVQQRSGGILK